MAILYHVGGKADNGGTSWGAMRDGSYIYRFPIHTPASQRIGYVIVLDKLKYTTNKATGADKV